MKITKKELLTYATDDLATAAWNYGNNLDALSAVTEAAAVYIAALAANANKALVLADAHPLKEFQASIERDWREQEEHTQRMKDEERAAIHRERRDAKDTK